MGDFNGDGTVNGTDLNVVLSNYNQSAGVDAAVPEPSTLLLAAAGLAACWPMPGGNGSKSVRTLRCAGRVRGGTVTATPTRKYVRRWVADGTTIPSAIQRPTCSH